MEEHVIIEEEEDDDGRLDEADMDVMMAQAIKAARSALKSLRGVRDAANNPGSILLPLGTTPFCRTQ